MISHRPSPRPLSPVSLPWLVSASSWASSLLPSRSRSARAHPDRRPSGAFHGLALCALLAVAAEPVAALDGPLQTVIDTHVQPLLADPALIAAIRAQNAQTGGFSDAQVSDLDARWMSEIGAAEIPTIAPVWHNATADILRARVDASAGLIQEVLLMDARGLNVAVSHVTSDYWQGDEAKYLETFPLGAAAVHVGEIEFDESSQMYMQQLSVSVPDPDTGAPIGALTLGLNAEMLP